MKRNEIKNILKKYGIEYMESEDNKIEIRSCWLGDNFFDYGEEERPLQIKKKALRFLANANNVRIITCDLCCSCAGW